MNDEKQADDRPDDEPRRVQRIKVGTAVSATTIPKGGKR